MRIRTELTSDYVNEIDYKIAEVSDALAHPMRVALVRYLSAKNNGKGIDNVTCNKDLVELFDCAQSTMSQHVKILKNCGLFITESRDKFTFYYLNRDLLKEYTDYINSI